MILGDNGLTLPVIVELTCRIGDMFVMKSLSAKADSPADSDEKEGLQISIYLMEFPIKQIAINSSNTQSNRITNPFTIIQSVHNFLQLELKASANLIVFTRLPSRLWTS